MQAPPSRSDAARIKVCVFDMFGTLYDVHSVVQACRDAFGDEGEDFSEVWRREQLEYSWKRSLMRRWVPFWQVTRDALEATLETYDRGGETALRDRLLDAYREVSPYPDSGPALEALNEAGVRCAILTNGSRDMVTSALEASGFQPYFERVFSVDDIEVFKPDPRVYEMARGDLDIEAGEILMVSSHTWDLAGAISCGFQGVWIDRAGTGHHRENLGFDPEHRVSHMGGLVELVTGRK